MIDFTATQMDNTETKVEFLNLKGEVVKTYALSELEKFVTDNHLNISYDQESKGGTGMVCDPNTDFTEIEVVTPVSEYIDDNWFEVTEKFYNSVNASSFKSFNTETQTRKALLCR